MRSWLTPPSIIEALGPFDLDPCAHKGHETAKTMIWSLGLEPQWNGRVWLNPPYSQVGQWFDKLAEHNYGIALVFARTDTKWAQRVMPKAESIFFPAGRIKFLRADGSKPQGTSGAPSMFLSFGERPDWLKVMPGWIAK